MHEKIFRKKNMTKFIGAIQDYHLGKLQLEKETKTSSVNPTSSTSNKDWAKKFEKVKSATSTNKAKGG